MSLAELVRGERVENRWVVTAVINRICSSDPAGKLW